MSAGTTPVAYEPNVIEPAWQSRWAANDTYEVRDDLPREQCYYVLEMFPYPSGKLHMGHVRNYSIGDAIARYKRQRGFHVLHPMGWDSFGLPAEQAAIDRGIHPKSWTYDNIAHMRQQLQRLGFSYAWDREFATSDDDYAAKEQHLILDLVEQGLVYRKSSVVNWSTGLNTVLANEQVVDGKCWRTGAPVIQKELPSWFFRTTAYAQELLDELPNLTEWPEAVKKQQTEWLGRSRGAEIDFPVVGHEGKKITVFTTRPDTVFGVTFCSIAPEHPLLAELVDEENQAQLQDFIAELASQDAEERTGENAEKKGVPTGLMVRNPVNGDEVPLYAANFVLADYGTGAVMAVPAHDTRDFAFAQVYGLPVTTVIAAPESAEFDATAAAWTEPGTMVNSGTFDGMESLAAKDAIIDWLAAEGFGREAVTWRYRDWGVSRQRYWGNPLPFTLSEQLGPAPLRAVDLPATLPEDVDITGTGNPLAAHPTWKHTANDGSPLTVATGNGKEPAERETDTMDTFVQSSWYFARFTCANAEEPLDRARVDHWLPVDLYVGGIEHATMHLLYARFFQKALCDTGHASVREPFKRLLCQGMVVAETFYREVDGKKIWYNPTEVAVERNDKGGAIGATLLADGQPVVIGGVEKMSKSKNNGVDPQALIEQYGADAARLFSLFAAPPERDLHWDDAGLAGCYRFIKRLWALIQENRESLLAQPAFAGGADDFSGEFAKNDDAVWRKTHQTIKRATDAMERDFGFNTAIAACMELVNEVRLDRLSPAVARLALETLVQLLAPMAPHLCAELWAIFHPDAEVSATGAEMPWPQLDEAALQVDRITYPVQINGKVRGRVEVSASAAPDDVIAAALAEPSIASNLAGKNLVKKMAVPGKIVVLVAK